MAEAMPLSETRFCVRAGLCEMDRDENRSGRFAFGFAPACGSEEPTHVAMELRHEWGTRLRMSLW